MDGLDRGHAALAVVDMQNDFVDPEVGSYAIGADRMVTRIARLVAAAPPNSAKGVAKSLHLIDPLRRLVGA